MKWYYDLDDTGLAKSKLTKCEVITSASWKMQIDLNLYIQDMQKFKILILMVLPDLQAK